MARKVNAEIAVRLGISSDGVKYHVSNMLGKLGLETREELAAWKPGRERVSFVRSFFAAPAASKWTGLGVAATVAGGAVLVAGLWGLRGSAEDTSDWFANGVVSRGYDGSPSNGSSADPVVSADGRFVAFSSEASNLVPGDTNGTSDVFVFDRKTGATTLVSVGMSGAANGNSNNPSISADGRFIAFESTASNLVAEPVVLNRGVINALVESMQPWIAEMGGTPEPFAKQIADFELYETAQVYVRDLTKGATERVSVGYDGEAADIDGRRPSISADGRFVAFSSVSTNLVRGDSGGPVVTALHNPYGSGYARGRDVYVRDREDRTTDRISASAAGARGDAASDHAKISADGRFVVFKSDANNLVPGRTPVLLSVSTDGEKRSEERADYYVARRGTGEVVRIPMPAIAWWFEGVSVSGRSETVWLGASGTEGDGGLADSAIYRFDITSGVLTRIEGGNDPTHLVPNVAHDGEFYALYTSRSARGNPLTVRSVAGRDSWQASATIARFKGADQGWSVGYSEPSVSDGGHVVAGIARGNDRLSGSDVSEVFVATRP